MSGKAAAAEDVEAVGGAGEGISASAAPAAPAAPLPIVGEAAASVASASGNAGSYFSFLTRPFSKLLGLFEARTEIPVEADPFSLSVKETDPTGASHTLRLFFREPTMTFSALRDKNFVSYFIGSHGALIPKGYSRFLGIGAPRFPESFIMKHPFPTAIIQTGGEAAGCYITQSAHEVYSALASDYIEYTMSHMLFSGAHKYVPPMFRDIHFSTSDTMTYTGRDGKPVVNYEIVPNRILTFSDTEKQNAKYFRDFYTSRGQTTRNWRATLPPPGEATLLFGVYVYDPQKTPDVGLVRDDRFDTFFGDGKEIDLATLFSEIPKITGINRPSIFTIPACVGLCDTSCAYDKSLDLHFARSKYSIPRISPVPPGIPSDVLPPTVLLKRYLAPNGESTETKINLRLTTAALPAEPTNITNHLTYKHRFGASRSLSDPRLKALLDKYDIPLENNRTQRMYKSVRFKPKLGTLGVGPRVGTRSIGVGPRVGTRSIGVGPMRSGFGPERLRARSVFNPNENYYRLNKKLKKAYNTASEKEKAEIRNARILLRRHYMSPTKSISKHRKTRKVRKN